jgi:serine/threonine-protein kinase OSR1/STK39
VRPPRTQGGSVAHILKYAHPSGLPEALIASVMRPVAQALEYVHANGGMHRCGRAGFP